MYSNTFVFNWRHHLIPFSDTHFERSHLIVAQFDKMPACLPSRSKTAHFSSDVISPCSGPLRQKSCKSNQSDTETSPAPICSYSFFFRRKNSRRHSSGKRQNSRKNSHVVVRNCKKKNGKESISQQSTTVTTISDHGVSSRDTSLVSYQSFVTCLQDSDCDLSDVEDIPTHVQGNYVTAVNCVPLDDEDSNEVKVDTDIKTESNTQIIQPCACKCKGHYMHFDPVFPLITKPGIEKGGQAESLCIANAMCGHWVTVLDRSESLDPQFKIMGINYIKRSVMNKLAVPLTLKIEKNDTVLHVYVHTPLGLRHMESNLCGEYFYDDDVDCGRWEGKMAVVDYSIEWFCGGKTVRALQQVRENKKINATQIETRCVIPDLKEGGKMMLFNFKIYHNNDKNKVYVADRILKYVSDGSDQKLK